MDSPRAIPCGRCRPELADHLNMVMPNPNDPNDGLRRSWMIRTLARPSRVPQQNGASG